jgi:hypothetical protein
MEKKTEVLLSAIVGEENVYFTPKENNLLALLFKNASKKNTNNLGIPDRLYYSITDRLLIIYECKPSIRDLNKSLNELRQYFSNMDRKIMNDNLDYVVLVGFCGCEKNVVSWEVRASTKETNWNIDTITPLSVSPSDIKKTLNKKNI